MKRLDLLPKIITIFIIKIVKKICMGEKRAFHRKLGASILVSIVRNGMRNKGYF